MSIDALVEMSRRYGADEEFVIAGGGNTSYKENGIMYVKASGTPLASIEADGFVAMNLQALKDTLKAEYPKMMSPADIEMKSFDAIMSAKEPGQEGVRPSVESLLHALFPHKYVLHLHPAIVNGLTCSADFFASNERLFGTRAVCVGAMPPGPGLAKLCDSVFREASQNADVFPQIAFLQNHGIFIAADSAGEIDDLVAYVIDTLTGTVKEFPDITESEFVAKGIEKYKIRDNPLTPEQVISPDDEALLRNAVKIAVYAQSFGGLSPLPAEIVNTMKEFNPYA